MPQYSPESVLVTTGVLWPDQRSALTVLTFPAVTVTGGWPLLSAQVNPLSPFPHPTHHPVQPSSHARLRDPFTRSLGSHSSSLNCRQEPKSQHWDRLVTSLLSPPPHWSLAPQASIHWLRFQACSHLPCPALCSSVPPHQASPSTMSHVPNPGSPTTAVPRQASAWHSTVHTAADPCRMAAGG